MRSLLRRLRGVVTTALLWAPVWSLVGAGMASYQANRMHRFHRAYWANEDGAGAMIAPGHVPVTLRGWGWDYVGYRAASWAVVGAISGAAFALALAALERRRTLGQLAMGRVAAWGALGALTLPLVLLANILADPGMVPGDGSGREWLGLSLLLGALGAACSTATLALARRSDPDDPRL